MVPLSTFPGSFRTSAKSTLEGSAGNCRPAGLEWEE